MPGSVNFLSGFCKFSKTRTNYNIWLVISLIIALCCVHHVVSEDIENSHAETETNNASRSTNTFEEEYSDYADSGNSNKTSWRDRNWRRQDGSKIAQVVVYFSVILIALVGVLIKYFVTQYETSQFKAQEQLDYQRLQNA